MDFGSYLRQARERRGISLRQIAGATKISAAALEALERNDVSKLPGGIFSRAFVRSYAIEVGLDPEDTIRQFLAQFAQEPAAPGGASAPIPQLAANEEESAFENQRRVAGTVLGLVALSIPLAGLIIYFSMRSPRVAAPSPSTPSAVSAPARPVEVTPTPPPAAANPAPRPQSGAPPAAAPNAAAPPAPATPPAAAAEAVTLELAPSGPCWVTATADGQRLFSRLMQPGEREVVRAEKEVRLSIGDAGAFAFRINDAPGRTLGAAGEVVTATITPQNYRSYAR